MPNKNTPVLVCFFTIFLSLFLCNSEAQKLAFEMEQVVELDTSLNEYKVKDINGERCSMVLLNTQFEGIKFGTNLGIEKILKINTGYKIFIPSAANLFRISVPGFPLFEYKLPASDYSFAVYIFNLGPRMDTAVIYSDSISSKVSISTIPQNARVYMNHKKIGRTPLMIDSFDNDIVEYTIKKWSYEPLKTSQIADKKINDFCHELISISGKRSLFLIPNISKEEFGLLKNDLYSYIDPVFGVTIGLFGKTGFFLSGKLKNQIIQTEYIDQYDQKEMYGFYAGITQQIARNYYIFAGNGYLYRYVNIITGSNQNYGRTTYSRIENSNNMYSLNLGMVARISWHFLLQAEIQYSPSVNLGYYNFGFGYNFGPVKTYK